MGIECLERYRMRYVVAGWKGIRELGGGAFLNPSICIVQLGVLQKVGRLFLNKFHELIPSTLTLLYKRSSASEPKQELEVQ